MEGESGAAAVSESSAASRAAAGVPPLNCGHLSACPDQPLGANPCRGFSQLVAQRVGTFGCLREALSHLVLRLLSTLGWLSFALLDYWKGTLRLSLQLCCPRVKKRRRHAAAFQTQKQLPPQSVITGIKAATLRLLKSSAGVAVIIAAQATVQVQTGANVY